MGQAAGQMGTPKDGVQNREEARSRERMQAFLKGGSLSAASKEKSVGEKAGSSGSGREKKKKLEPWVEKYRPKCVDDVAYQDEVVAVLKKSLQGMDLPNLLFYGPPGTGKTSTILAASKELFGDMYKSRILELNASDERGINVVREKVKTFSQLSASGIRPDGKPCPPFKIVILDEADSMTNPAQAALRRTMEKESRTTRFCLICNYVSRIIEPITSRCAKFRFKPLADGILRKKLTEICEKENVQYDEEAVEALLHTSEGDMRKAITCLQSSARFRGEETIRKLDVYEIAGVIPANDVDNLLKVCHSDSYEKLERKVQELMSEGYSATQTISQIHDKIISSEELGDKQKSIICEKLAVVDKRLLDGADEYLQIMDLTSIIMQQICHGTK